jgi:transposase
MSMAKRKNYSREFKIETVKAIADGGVSAAEISRDLGVHPNTLYKWVQQFSSRPDEAFPGKGHLTSEAEEIRQLKREVERLKMEREILKKAMAIFSKDPS